MRQINQAEAPFTQHPLDPVLSRERLTDSRHLADLGGAGARRDSGIGGRRGLFRCASLYIEPIAFGGL